MLRKLLAGVLAATLVLSAPVYAEKIPFVRGGDNLAYVEFSINGSTYVGVLDTGASSVLINSEVYNDLLAKGLLKKSDILRSDMVSMLADGGEVQTLVFKARQFRFGNRVYHDVPIWVLPGKGMVLIGQDLIRQYRTFTMDNEKNIIEVPD